MGAMAMKNMSKEIKPSLIENIKTLLNNAFHGGAWHGPSVLELVKGVSLKEAAFRAGNVHSIAELILLHGGYLPLRKSKEMQIMS
jgi:hypothetical protein